MSIRSNCCVATATMSFVALSAFAGPLNPPAGPVASTPGPEPRIAINATNTPGDADSVFRITQPGSYYLTGNVQGSPGRSGIEIASQFVTVDLNGFAVIGSSASLQGVVTTLAISRGVTVRNGHVHSWASDGLRIASTFLARAVVEDVVSSLNGGAGIRVGVAGAVTNCIADGNLAGGIVGEQLALVTDCIAVSNPTAGISVGERSSVQRCVAASNPGAGIIAGLYSSIVACFAGSNSLEGVRASDECIIDTTVATGNSLTGISAGSRALLRGCQANGNGQTANNDGAFVGFDSNVVDCVFGSNFGDGLEFSGGSRISGCIATNNVRGFASNGGFTRVENCQSATNTSFGYEFSDQSSLTDSYATNNGDDGVRAGRFTTVTRVEATDNNADGFEIGAESVISECAAILNSRHGFLIGQRTTISHSRASQNGGPSGSGQQGYGFNCFGDNILDSNTSLGNDIGFALLAVTGCSLTRNIARANATNYNITLPGSNDIGPIGAASALSSPWGNISN